MLLQNVTRPPQENSFSTQVQSTFSSVQQVRRQHTLAYFITNKCPLSHKIQLFIRKSFYFIYWPPEESTISVCLHDEKSAIFSIIFLKWKRLVQNSGVSSSTIISSTTH